ncbi:phosphopantetheine-binding protein, partial [Flavobacterium psychroterrae]
VLGVETIGITDNFFELGGHSLSATVVINKIMKSLNIEISLRDFLFKNDIRGIAEVISEREWLTTEVSFKNEIII